MNAAPFALTLATRRSQLALAQARAFAQQLQSHHAGLTITELHVVTTGDRIQDRPLTDIGGKGLFIKEIEEAILERRAHFAVHSIKDVTAFVAPGLQIACIPARADARDVLVSRTGLTLRELPAGSKVGTSSLRRMTSLRLVRPDLQYVPLRGNVDTRIRKVREGVVDATVLAYAGLQRLGLLHEAVEVLDVELSLPAIGQGALGIECRQDDEATIELLRPLHDEPTAIAVGAERGVMIEIEGSCKTPVAAYGVRDAGELWLRAALAQPDGTNAVFDEQRFPWPAHAAEAEQVGRRLGRQLQAKLASK